MEFTKHSYASNYHVAISRLTEKKTSQCSVPITYFMASETVEHKTYGIAAYGPLVYPPILTVKDVSPDGDLVFRMVRAFNEHKLSPLHLMDAINDMLG